MKIDKLKMEELANEYIKGIGHEHGWKTYAKIDFIAGFEAAIRLLQEDVNTDNHTYELS